MEKKKVAVGMSGGVDSAVSALLLKEQGYDVTGIFMKNWDDSRDSECAAADDFFDVRRVCDTLDIPYYTVDFEEDYWQRVFTYFLDEYKRARTPNPDVLCNSEIKFKSFLDFCMDTGAQFMATGHYARSVFDGDGSFRLLKGLDAGKDQTYFLCMVGAVRLSKTLFPIGHMQKRDVRALAQRAGLPVAAKKDSTGICFIGERKFREFLSRYLPAQKGEIRTLSGEYVKDHDGLMYYTLGQRRGLDIGGCGTGERWFVVGKDVRSNVLYVEQGEDSPALYSSSLTTGPVNFIRDPFACRESFRAGVKVRYRQPDQPATVTRMENGCLQIVFDNPQRAVTPGQYAVLYLDDECLGGGVIETMDAPAPWILV